MIARWIGAIVGLFYLGTGLWSFLAPTSFYATVANFTPYNSHLLHDVGAFQVGLGVALIAGALIARGLMVALIGALIASLLHLVAHLLDLHLGGHPATDLPALTLIAVALGLAVYLELAHRAADLRQ